MQYLLLGVPKVYKGTLSIIHSVSNASQPETLFTFRRCIRVFYSLFFHCMPTFQKIISGEFELELRCVFKNIKRDLVGSALSRLEHRRFRKILDGHDVSAIVFPMENRGLLVLFQRYDTVWAKIVSTWDEFQAPLADLMKFPHDTDLWTGKESNLPFNQSFLDEFRQSFPALCPTIN